MQALQAINFSQEVFKTIVQYGPINYAAIASQLESTSSVVSKTVYELVKRGYVARTEDTFGNITFTALVEEQDVMFYVKRKPAATLFAGRALKAKQTTNAVATVAKAQITPEKKVTQLEEIFNYIADFAKPSLNPTEVHDAFPEFTYSMVSSAMWKLVNKHKYLINNDGQYSLAIKKADAVFSNGGRPVGSYKNVINVNGQEIKIKATEAIRLFKQLNKHYG